jgi:hypothetical protein
MRAGGLHLIRCRQPADERALSSPLDYYTVDVRMSSDTCVTPITPKR